MNSSRTLRDPNQILVAEHDPENDAKRVIIVAGEYPTFKMPTIDFSSMKMPDLKFPEFLKVEVPVIVPEIKIIEVPIPVITTEVKIVEVPTYVTTTEIKIIETQVVVPQKELQIERVEIPIVIKEIEIVEKPVLITEYKNIPNLIKILLIVQVLISIISLLKK